MKLSQAVITFELLKKYTVSTGSGSDAGELWSAPIVFEPAFRKTGYVLIGGRDLLDRVEKQRGNLAVIICNEMSSKTDGNSPYIIIKDTGISCREVFEYLLDVFEQYENWDTALKEAALNRKEDPDLSALVRVGESLIRTPFAILDRNNKYTAFSLSYKQKFVITYKVGEDMNVPWSFINDPAMRMNWKRIIESDEVFSLSFAETDCDIIGKCFLKNGSYEGHLGFVIEDPSERDYYTFMLEHFHFYVSGVYLQLTHSGRPRQNSTMQFLIQRRLNGKDVSEMEWADACTDIGWGNKPVLRVIAFRMHPYHFTAKTDSTLYADNLRVTFDGKWRGTISFIFDDTCYLLLNESLFHAEGENDYRKALATFLRDNLLVAGISNEFCDPENLQDVCLQADAAVDLGITRSSFLWYFYFSDYKLSFINRTLSERMSVNALCDRSLLVLKEYDRVNGTEYFLTLKTYFRCLMNATETAKTLHIQRSTFIYRLSRIKKMTNIRLETFEELCLLSISFSLLNEPF